MLKLTYFILLIILSFYHLLEPKKKKTPTFLTFIGKKYLIKIMSGPVFSMPRRFWIFKAHPLLKKIKNVAPSDMKINQKNAQKFKHFGQLYSICRVISLPFNAKKAHPFIVKFFFLQAAPPLNDPRKTSFV